MSKKLIGEFTSKNNLIDMGDIYVIDEAYISVVKPTLVYYSLDNVRFFKTNVTIVNKKFFFKNLVARYIKFDFDCILKVYQGKGYIGKSEKKWTKLFVRNQFWVGGDGLYSFNLTGKDNYLADKNDVTLCVFGDTFNCTLSKDFVRLEPLAMPNNSYCLIDSTDINKAKAEFYINEDDRGHCRPFLSVNNDLGYKGTLASNLVNYNNENNWLSGINPKNDIEIEFDLYDYEHLDYLKVYNYFIESEKDFFYQNRGVKYIDLYIDDVFKQRVKISKASFIKKGLNFTKIKINQLCKKVKFVISNKNGIGNYHGTNGHESFFGLNKVYFYTKDKNIVNEINVKTNSEFLKEDKHAWFWMQDGVILNNKLYSLPLVVTSDTTKPEGFQFNVEGIGTISIDIKDNKPDFTSVKQEMTLFYKTINKKTYTLGAAFYNNSFHSSEKNPDGYIYIYGYLSTGNLESGNQLIVGRVKEDEFTNRNKWRFFNGFDWVNELEKAKPLVNHISCEFSLHYDLGKYILVFTYDVQSPYIAYATSSTPYGPFDETRIAYVCKEKLCPHMYLYNAKAHPHLSKAGRLLVSYNVNTSDFSENIKYGRTYGPRFVTLKRIGGKEDEN